MKDSAAAAHMTAGALYHHFSSKQGLFAAVFHRHQESAFDALEKVVANGGSFIERITLLLDAAAEVQTIDRGLARLTVVASNELEEHPELRAVVGGEARARYRLLSGMLAANPG